MQSFNNKRFYFFQADASALGGSLEAPFEKIIPTLAPVSLPPVGGFATARSGAFNLDDVVSCSAAYTRVTGRESRHDGPVSTLSTAVIEDLNILEVVTARRIVAQVSVTMRAGERRRISFAGTRFEGLRIAGCDRVPTLNAALTPSNGGPHESELPLTLDTIREAGRAQAAALVSGFERRGGNAVEWARHRHGWMTRSSHAEQRDDAPVLCSLVDGLDGTDAGGHILDIPGFGRIFLGEILVTRQSIQLVSIRAELGCPVSGVVAGPAIGGGGGSGDDD